MQTVIIEKTYRGQKVAVKAFALLDDLRAKVGDAPILNLYQEYYMARTVGGKVDAALEKKESPPTTFDLTEHMPVFGSRDSGSRDGLAKYRTIAKARLGKDASDEEITEKAKAIRDALVAAGLA